MQTGLKQTAYLVGSRMMHIFYSQSTAGGQKRKRALRGRRGNNIARAGNIRTACCYQRRYATRKCPNSLLFKGLQESFITYVGDGHAVFTGGDVGATVAVVGLKQSAV